MFQKILKLDWILILVTLLILGISLITLYSISSSGEKESASVFSKQLTFAIVGLAVMIIFILIDYHNLGSYSTPIYFTTLFVLVLVIIFGSAIRGTVGWIGVGSFHIQPVEIAKLALIIFLASFISKKKTELGGAVRLASSFILTGIMIFLVIKQPDFGSAMVLTGIWLGMMLFSGINKKHFIALVLIGAIITAAGWFFLADYQKNRILNLVNPEIDPRGSGYNALQSLIAVGSGGITGLGIGHGSQSQLNFLPEKHTDFIFAVVTEELGMIGSIIILLLYVAMFFRIKRIAMASPDNFGYLISSGIMVMLFMQVVINIGMNIKLMPITGLPLPFLSYGGSSLITSFIALGIMLNINLRKGKSRLNNPIM
jgi:rod shape determining protein RodA